MRLKVLIEDLFEVSKATSKNVKLELAKVDIISLLKQVRLELSERVEKSELDFRWNFQEEKVYLTLDSQKTYRIFENLLINILKYSLEGTRVYIDVYKRQGIYSGERIADGILCRDFSSSRDRVCQVCGTLWAGAWSRTQEGGIS